MNVEPYKKSLTDEIDFKIVDQLHGTVTQISSFCFEIKKICIATLFITLTFITKFTENKLDSSLFVACYLMIICFWFLDSTAYFYQVKLRGMMSQRIQSIEKRNNTGGFSDTDGILLADHSGNMIINKNRTSISLVRRVFKSGINHSMWLYALLLLLNIVSHYLFLIDIIK